MLHYFMFWFKQARRSMRFSQHLRDVADAFRRRYLNSTDESDQTVLDKDWTSMKVATSHLYVLQTTTDNILSEQDL